MFGYERIYRDRSCRLHYRMLGADKIIINRSTHEARSMSMDSKVGRMIWVSVHMVFLVEILLMKIEIKLQ